MAIVKISDIKDRIGTVIPSIGGTIISVFPAKSGKGQHGVWKLQNIKIQDSTGDCQVTLSSIDQDLNDSHKGKNIEFESVGTKFGLKGVSVEKRDYVDKKGDNVSTTGVKVTKTAKIKLEGAGMVQEDANDDIPMEYGKEGVQMEKAASTYKQVVENINKESVRQNNERNTKSPQERIAQFGKLYKMCFIEASKVEAAFGTDLIKDVATTFFIQACKEGLADKMDVDGKEPF